MKTSNLFMPISVAMLLVALSGTAAEMITEAGTYVITRAQDLYTEGTNSVWDDTICVMSSGEVMRGNVYGSRSLDAAGRDQAWGSGLNVFTWVAFDIPDIAPGLRVQSITVDIGGNIQQLNANANAGITVGYAHGFPNGDWHNLAYATPVVAEKVNRNSSLTSTPATRISTEIGDWFEGDALLDYGQRLYLHFGWNGSGIRGWRELSNPTTVTITCEKLKGPVINWR